MQLMVTASIENFHRRTKIQLFSLLLSEKKLIQTNHLSMVIFSPKKLHLLIELKNITPSPTPKSRIREFCRLCS